MIYCVAVRKMYGGEQVIIKSGQLSEAGGGNSVRPTFELEKEQVQEEEHVGK